MKFFKSRTLKVDILAAFTILIFLAVLCEILYSSFATKKLILSFEKEYYSKIVTNSATKRLDEHFEKIELLGSVLSTGVYDMSDAEASKTTFIEGLRKVPYMLSAYIGFNDGTFFQARKINSTEKFQTNTSKNIPISSKFAIRKMYREKKDQSLIESWHYLDEDMNSLASESLQKTQFDPSKREWYVQAELKKSNMWSDAYQFITNSILGMTFSIPFGHTNSSNGESSPVIGVVGIDITLDQLKNVLSFAKISQNAECYLLSKKGEILATSTDAELLKKNPDTGAITLKTVYELKDPKIQCAAKQFIETSDTEGTFAIDGVNYVCSFEKLSNLPLSLLIISPESDFTGALSKIKTDMLIISLIVLLFSFFIILIIARRISRPIIALCNSAKAIGNLDFDNYPEPPAGSSAEIQELSIAMDSMKLSITTFTKYAPKDLVKKLVQLGITPTLGGKSSKITLLFSDIEKFSSVSERLPAEYLILHISEYFDELTKEIMNHNGIIDKYIGDSIMAIWGAPNRDDNQVINACNAALSCQDLLKKLKEKWAPLGKPPLPTRIGLHTGEAIVGNIGSQDRMNYTAIGDNVNVASRLESANKFYGTYMLASETIEEEARGRILFRVVDRIAVKGKNNGLTVYEPLCALNNTENENYYQQIDLCAKTKEAFELYQNQEFKKAAEYYLQLQKDFPAFEKSLNFIRERCAEFSKNHPKDWDGVFHMDRK